MKQLLIYNRSHPGADPLRAEYCSSFTCRLRGLMLRRSLPSNAGLLLVQSSDSRLDASIHMLFMRMDLAVVWINNACQVVDVRLARCWRPVYLPAAPARYVLETLPEQLKNFGVGDRLEFEEESHS